MAKQRKQPTKQAGWMLAVMFNSLLILLPVIAANTVKQAYEGVGVAEQPTIDAIIQTKDRIDDAFEDLSPKEASRKLPFWQDKVQRALEDKDVDALRGYLIAAPSMLGNDLGKQVRARAEAETKGTADERMIRAALQKMPESVARAIEYEIGLPQTPIIPPEPEAAPVVAAASDAAPGAAAAGRETGAAPDAAAVPAEVRSDEEEIGEVLEAGVRPELDWRFRLLGNYGDLAAMSQRWIGGDLSDGIVFKLTGIGLVQQGISDGLSDANIRAVSIVKSASRSKRLTPEFTAYLDERTGAAVPREVLTPALEAALKDLATTDVRGARVRDAFEKSIDPAGLIRLETDLEQIDKIATLTSPTAALTLLSYVEDGTDLRRARMLAEAGGMQAVALVKERGTEALRVADAGVRWDNSMVLEIMSLTAAGMLLFWVALSTIRIYFPKRKPKAELIGA
ncbi:MAG: hypothetical protein IPK75_08665 [Acidobacteria bacterium]|nr:hypothetical protein [Acidobacteriota bacterium]